MLILSHSSLEAKYERSLWHTSQRGKWLWQTSKLAALWQWSDPKLPAEISSCTCSYASINTHVTHEGNEGIVQRLSPSPLEIVASTWDPRTRLHLHFQMHIPAISEAAACKRYQCNSLHCSFQGFHYISLPMTEQSSCSRSLYFRQF